MVFCTGFKLSELCTASSAFQVLPHETVLNDDDNDDAELTVVLVDLSALGSVPPRQQAPEVFPVSRLYFTCLSLAVKLHN